MSSLFAGEKVFDDSNIAELVGSNGVVMAGGEPRYLTSKPRPTAYGSAGMPTFDAGGFTAFSESEIIRRATILQDKYQRISDSITWKPKDQNGTPLCWSFGSCGACEVSRVQGGMPYESLSPASCAGPITGYSLRGGYGEEFLKQAKETGIASSKLWPDYSFKGGHSLRTPEVEESYENHKILTVYDCRSNDLLQLWTMLVLGKPCPLGLDWWGHLVFACDVVVERGIIVGTRFRNSWGDWEAKNVHGVSGFGVLSPAKSRGDCYAVVEMTSYAQAG